MPHPKPTDLDMNLFLERVEQPNISPKKPRNALSDARATNVTFSKFRRDAAKKKPRKFFETALRGVLIN